MNHSITASVIPSIIQGTPTASRIQPKNAIVHVSAAAPLRGSVIAVSVMATGIISEVDDRTATAPGVRAVGLPYGPLIAATVGLVVVDLGTTA